jgi:hypothetical protein
MNLSTRSFTFSWKYGLWSLLASTVFVPLAFWGVPLEEVWRSVQQADWRAVLLAVLLFVLTTLAKTWRWQLFFPARRVKFVSCFAALIVGQVVNFLLPARLGEVARIYILRRREGERAALALGTIGAEKIVELAALCILMVLVAPFVPWPAWLRDPSLRVTAFVLGALMVLSIGFVQQERLRAVWSWLARKLAGAHSERIAQQFDLTLIGFAPLRQFQSLWPIALWSLAIWCLMIATNYVLCFAFGIEPSWLMATVLLLVLQVGVSVPSTPGKIGVFQYLAALTLSLFGVPRELALGYGMVLYLVVLMPQLVMALPFVWAYSHKIETPSTLESFTETPVVSEKTVI